MKGITDSATFLASGGNHNSWSGPPVRLPGAHRKNNLGEIWRERNDAILLAPARRFVSCIVDDFSGGGGVKPEEKDVLAQAQNNSTPHNPRSAVLTLRVVEVSTDKNPTDFLSSGS